MLYANFALGIALFLTVLLQSDLLRHGTGSVPPRQKLWVHPKYFGPYSLGKCQFALWLTTIYCCELYQWQTLENHQLHPAATAVALLTISTMALCLLALNRAKRPAWQQCQYLTITLVALYAYLRGTLPKKELPLPTQWASVYLYLISTTIYVSHKNLNHE